MLIIVTLFTAALALADHHEGDRQYVEVRKYRLNAASDLAAVDAYMENALLPALERQGIGPVGVLSEAQPEAVPNVYLIIAYDSIEQFATHQEKLDADAAYQKAAADYFIVPKDQPRFARIESELLLSFKSWPRLQVPKQKKSGSERLFNLRTYENHSEHAGDVKVQMFNDGETPIFAKVGLDPVFMGRSIAGSMTPNLTYMVVVDDVAALEAGWKAFGAHPDWKKMSGMAKYKIASPSTIHNVWLRPRPYSGL